MLKGFETFYGGVLKSALALIVPIILLPDALRAGFSSTAPDSALQQ